ncbi:MAG: hypothetical protein DI626_02220 [Micavibrio aeruginosavorus]|uniref:Uncharacterized protein n=1 Tax=Micavibrio aeruginosavorus TaxID=349221 RepID=A0A2W5A4M0_9BACT|nr:MAG: hypothetical protein DI626_02220 [Micavibrio aeruginosavorus]
MKHIFTVIVVCLFLNACAAGNVHEYAVPKDPQNYVLGVGDTVNINVFQQENLSGEFKIGADGTIAFPLIKEIRASGLTTKELEGSISARLRPNYVVDPRVSVYVANYRDIYVLGEVRSPGKFEYSPNITILQAVAMAGGHTYRAKENTAEIMRHAEGALQTLTVDSKTVIRPGDTVIIKRRWF